MQTRFSAYQFKCFDTAPNTHTYSKMKFGSDSAAYRLGSDLAFQFFQKHADVLLANPCVVIPSPYNFVKNAATIMTEHFINRLNRLIVDANGEHVEYSIIHRKVSYINDYGFLSKDKRKGLIDNDKFFLNKKYLEGKTLIFIDDVRITGTHEEKLVEILDNEAMMNPTFFLYYAEYHGTEPDVESKLNFAAVNCLRDYTKLTEEPNHHLIVRPIKYLLSQPLDHFNDHLDNISLDKRLELYHACLGEGYYKIPQYQDNFQSLSKMVEY